EARQAWRKTDARASFRRKSRRVGAEYHDRPRGRCTIHIVEVVECTRGVRRGRPARLGGFSMAERVQTYKNHPRLLPPFHFFVVPVLLVHFLNQIRHLWLAPSRSTGWS